MLNESPDQLWVELVGGIILARIRGVATADLIQECHQRIVMLQRDTGCKQVMYDALELERPPIEIVLTQQGLTDALKQADVKVAIVVPNTGIAYLARLAFGEANHRVFYNDIAAAVSWLAVIDQ
ncbi:hypothetical protein NDA01_27650 [Trichocoleus desertorum AS-A10]